MKKLFVFLFFISTAVQALTFSDIKFGTKQMGDAQWNVNACTFTTTCSSSAQNVGSFRNGSGVNFTLGATQYIKFSYTNTDPAEPWTITAYNANGTVAAVLGTYRIINAGQGYFMTSNQPHPNAGNGTLWSTQTGMISSSKTYTEILQPTQAQMDSLANSYYSPDPIYTAGATYTPPQQYSAGISAAQQSRVTAFQVRTITSNSIYIDQVGDNNTVNIAQSGNNNSIAGIGQQAASIQGNNNTITIRQGAVSDTGKNEINLRAHGDYNTLNINQGVTTTGVNIGSTNNHYQSVDVIGNYNAVTTQQTNTGGIGGHYMETTVNGNNNNVIAKQTDNANKTMFTTVSGNNNTVDATQSGTGQHYLETTLTGNGNSALVTQTGSTQNRASISITNAGGPGAVDLQQTGGQVYNITTTCVTAGGCGTVTVRQ